MRKIVLFAACLLVLAGCKNNQEGTDSTVVTAVVDYTQVAVPDFSADSAYAYVEAQLAFGNRIPGSKGWQQCADYLVRKMSRWCDTVIV